MLQNEAVTCYFEGKHCIQRIAALRYFRYSDSKELAITIFVSSALLLPALLHRTDNTPPPSCQSGSRARRTSSRVGLFLFPQVSLPPSRNRSIADPGNAGPAIVAGPFNRVGAGAFEFEAHRLALVPALEFLAEAVGVDPPLAGIAWLDIAAEADRGRCRRPCRRSGRSAVVHRQAVWRGRPSCR